MGRGRRAGKKINVLGKVGEGNRNRKGQYSLLKPWFHEIELD